MWSFNPLERIFTCWYSKLGSQHFFQMQEADMQMQRVSLLMRSMRCSWDGGCPSFTSVAGIRYSDQKQHRGEKSLFSLQFQVPASTEAEPRQELNQASSFNITTVGSREKPVHPHCLPAATYVHLAFSTLKQFRIFCLGNCASHIQGGSSHSN